MSTQEIVDRIRNGDLSNLYGANLYRADLRRANLSEADLYGANLYGADLRRANLRRANLRRANLSEADLRGANLSEADLRGANLSEADLYGANLSEADLRGAKNIPVSIAASLSVAPETGAFEAYKKLRGGYIAHLLVPSMAKRSSATTRKLRVSEALVLLISASDGSLTDTPVASLYDPNFLYETGKTVRPLTPFDEDRWNECASGIHCFITRREALDYP